MMAEQRVLFCPFCRESFEGEAVCPEHEMALVPFERLPAAPHLDGDDEELAAPLTDSSPLGLFEPRFGRGLVGVGALLNAAALGAEFVRGVNGSPGLRTFEVAATAPTLWTLLLVSFTLCFVLQRRRTPRALRSVRVLVPALALVSPLCVAWVIFRLHHGAAVRVTGGRLIGLELGWAPYLVALASLLIFIGGLRLGLIPPQPRELS